MTEGVSFVVTVYNKAPWLPRVLSQLAGQRGDFEREFVLVDDGSTDGSPELLAAFARDRPDVTVLAQTDMGATAAMNRGIERARMPFIKLCDADDLIPDGATEALLRALRARPDAVLAYGEGRLYDRVRKPDLEADLLRAPVTLVDKPLRLAVRNSIFNPSRILVKTAAVRACGRCDERVRNVQDYSLALRLALEGPFLRVSAPAAFIPRFAPGRLGENRGRELCGVTRILALFLADHPDLPWRLKQFACRRAAGRARRWALRFRRSSLPAARRLHMRDHLPIRRGHAAFVAACARLIR